MYTILISRKKVESSFNCLKIPNDDDDVLGPVENEGKTFNQASH